MSNVSFPSFSGYAGESVSIELDGFTVTATLHQDDDSTPPWDREDGHGPVSDWRYFESKRPGERVLKRDRDSAVFYDFAEAIRIAKRDAWGVPGGSEGMTPGQKAAAAVEADFRALKAWCNDDWAYCGIVLTVEREGVSLVDDFAHAVWGAECNYPGSDNAYLSEVAGELLDAALDDARAVLARLAA